VLKIDTHTHILPKLIPKFKEKFGYGGFIQLEHKNSCSARMLRDDGTFFRDIESNCWDPEQRLKECSDHHVDVQVLSTVPVMFSYWAKPDDGLELSRSLNDHIASVVRENPRRFVGLGTLPMQAPLLAVKELERSLKSGLCGVQIGTNVNGANLDDEKLFPIYEAAESLGAPLFVHPWEMLGQERMKKYWLPWLVGMPAETTLAICSMIFGGVFKKFPKLRVAFAHGGGSFGATVGRINHGFQARPDLCAVNNDVSPKDYLGKFFVDSLVHDANALRFLIQTFGANRIMLGTDYPFPLGEDVPGALIDSLTDLDQGTRDGLLFRAALEWLGLDASHFGKK
jgi:aminocarboxymuconate-semialdehyde decarboxylase